MDGNFDSATGTVNVNKRRRLIVSKANAIKFLDLLAKDKALQANVRDCVLAEDHFVRIGKKHDLKFSAQELEEALLEKWGHRTLKTLHPMVTFSQPPGF
jgi:Nif11 domain